KAIKPPTPDNELSSGPWRRRRASARRTRLCFFCHSCPGALLPPSLSRRTFWVPEASTVCCVINHEQQTTRALNSRSSCDFSRAQLLAPPTRWSEIQVEASAPRPRNLATLLGLRRVRATAPLKQHIAEPQALLCKLVSVAFARRLH